MLYKQLKSYGIFIIISIRKMVLKQLLIIFLISYVSYEATNIQILSDLAKQYSNGVFYLTDETFEYFNNSLIKIVNFS